MLKILATILFSGENFSPTEAEEKLGLKFTEKHEKGELFENKKHQWQVGYSKIEPPNEIGFFDRILWLCQQIDRKTVIKAKRLGASSIHFYIGYFYDNQCNCELTVHELKAISKLGISFAFSYYKCPKKEFDLIK